MLSVRQARMYFVGDVVEYIEFESSKWLKFSYKLVVLM